MSGAIRCFWHLLCEFDEKVLDFSSLEWLGHSDFSTTANIYAHLDYASKLSSAQAMLEGLGYGNASA